MNEAPKTREIQLTGASMQFLCTSNLDVTLGLTVSEIRGGTDRQTDKFC